MNERQESKDGSFKGLFPPQKRREDFYRERMRDRSTEELHRIIEERDRAKIKKDVLGTNGERLAQIEYNPKTREVISVFPEQYLNVHGRAEQNDELVYTTDDKGNVTKERLTRAEARKQKKRYLIVTTMLYYENQMLVQKRSPNKHIDPERTSTSAHGVAKEVFIEADRVTNAQTAALINATLEMNEELRHNASPFKVRIWPGNHLELFEYADEQKFDDPDTVWLIAEAFVPNDGYPLGSLDNPRSRGLFAGFIFSKEKKPAISFDPNELESVEWKNFRETISDPGAAKDLPEAMLKIHEEILRDNPYVRKYGPKLHENWMRRLRGEEVDKP